MSYLKSIYILQVSILLQLLRIQQMWSCNVMFSTFGAVLVTIVQPADAFISADAFNNAVNILSGRQTCWAPTGLFYKQRSVISRDIKPSFAVCQTSFQAVRTHWHQRLLTLLWNQWSSFHYQTLKMFDTISCSVTRAFARPDAPTFCCNTSFQCELKRWWRW